MDIKNIETSILMKLKNQAKKEGIAYQVSLQLFFQEEFLRKLSLSEYKNKMVLKGGMFIYTLTAFDSRPTRDMDFMIRWMSNELSNIRSVMEHICSIQTENPYIHLEVIGTEQITVEKKYPGVKTKLVGHIGNVRVPFSIDIGVDDIIIPGAVIRPITTRLEGFSRPEIYTYSLESTIAEKVDAILQRMETTSRMKDFFDIYYLSGMFDFNGHTLQEAIARTTEHRAHTLEKSAFDRISVFASDPTLSQRWSSFEPAQNNNLSFQETLDRIHIFIEPIVLAILDNSLFSMEWSSTDLCWNTNK